MLATCLCRVGASLQLLHIASFLGNSIFDVNLLGRSGRSDCRDRDQALDLTTVEKEQNAFRHVVLWIQFRDVSTVMLFGVCCCHTFSTFVLHPFL